MKKILLFLLSSSLMLNLTLAQNETCILLKDSISGGDEATSYDMYFYDANMRIVKVDKTDSNEMEAYSFDTLIYDTGGKLTTVIDSYYQPSSVSETTVFKYLNDKISRVEVDGDNGDGPWKMAHDVTYNVNDEIESIVLDDEFTSGNSEGFNASFMNLIWTNGNITSLDLIGDIGESGIDTLEITITYDDKKNFEQLQYMNEAPDLIMHMNNNNLLEMTFDNDEEMGDAGTIAMKRSYTYYDNDEVMEVTEHPGVFNSDSSVHKMLLDCSVGINSTTSKTPLVSVYPNPVKGNLNIAILDDFKHASVTIYSIIGSRLQYREFNYTENINMNISSLPVGIYFIKIEYDNHLYSTKIIKE